MSEQPLSGPEQTDVASAEPVPDCIQQFLALQAEEAVRFAGHQFDEDGWHHEEECRRCLESKAVVNACKCGDCCRRLIIEVDLEDAEREPKIKELGSPIYTDERLTASGQAELAGYLLNRTNGVSMACVFLDEAEHRCTIYPTRPLLCRLFDCDGQDREELVQLGNLPDREID